MPFAISLLGIVILEDVEYSAFSTLIAAAKQKVAIRQFHNLSFIAVECRTCIDSTEWLPIATEVVGIEHHVANICAQCLIDAVIFARLYLAALADFSGGEKELMHSTVH